VPTLRVRGGTDVEVDEYHASGIHNDEKKGSNEGKPPALGHE
jgi:hypothetical protein